VYPGLAASLILAIFTVYSYPAVVVDKTSGLRAIKNSFGAASHHLGITLTYSLVRVLFQILLTLSVLLASFISIPLSALSGALLSLLLTPILHSTKTMIYHQANPNIPEMPFQLSNSIWYDISRRLPKATWLKIRTGLVEVGRFAIGPKNLPFHLLSVLAFVLGIFAGTFVSTNGVADWLLSQGYVPGRGNPILNQVLQRLALGIDIFLNNWLVSIATGLAGIGFAVPSFTTILFNGFILGVILPISSNFTMFLAAILPHGIIEIPSFILAGSMGIKLGYAAWRTRLERGPESNDYLSSTLRQAVYVVVGLAPLLLVAGLIEADVTPVIMKMFGWTF
jgi:stage II sporulation protein M